MEESLQTNTVDAVEHLEADVVISGGGPVGLMLAIGLAMQHRDVVLVEQFEQQDEQQIDQVKNSFDGRVLAISQGSQAFLQAIGVWDALKPYATPIEHIHVSQKGYLGLTTLHAEEVDVSALGYSVQSYHFGVVLWEVAQKCKNIKVFCPALLEGFTDSGDVVKASVASVGGSQPIANVEAKLIVGADGTQSKVRQVLGLPLEEKSYAAFGILAQIETAQHPNGWAFERFTDEGPVALLPVQNHFHKAVMICPAEKVEQVMALDDEAYMALFASKMGERLGEYTQVSPRACYPLKETYVPQMSKGRAVLMGNASHTQHPVAAQGLNLGIRDIEVFLDMVRQQEDLGDPRQLQGYAQRREPDHQKVMGLTDSLIEIFQHSSPVVGHLRGIGMMAMQAMPGLKRRFSKFAMRGKRA